MKTNVLSSVALLAMLGLSAALPQGTRDLKRVIRPDDVVATDDSRKEANEVPQVVVYVNEEGTLLTTTTEAVRLELMSRAISRAPIAPDLESRSEAASSRALNSNPDLGSPSALPVSTTSASASLSSQSSSSSSSSSSPSASASSSLHGVAYAPYTATGDCKSAAQVEVDFAELKGKYSIVRTYGTDCDQVAKVLSAARNTDLKLFLGLFDIGSIEQQVQTIMSAVKGDWSSIDTISVGNELVNNGKATAQEVITAMGQARQLLRAAGYKGPVVTVDTFVAVLANPSLCDLSDYCAVNIHPFFDASTAAKDAGSFVASVVNKVQAKLLDRGKRVVCTETGWPWQGDSNGAAVPGIDEQRLAVDSIKKAYASHPGDVILFSAFNDLWKHSEASTFHAEQYWGIGGLYSDSGK
ncbi:cell wall glucanase [Colletotrichum truncatum]|uniref:Cell wall glucanase n=1 Tax=Colletotrichum truncatum TaxID=5467 RepID=A0ACC3YXQ3_COLTU|nr:cell wall glucanase [Colletotrichum truncatum]KAF6791005.1 cell wall glucanase [Colletotrichum truncatum]